MTNFFIDTVLCMDTVAFYAASEGEKKGLAALKQAIHDCYFAETSGDDSELRRIFKQNGIPTDGIDLRSNVMCVRTEDNHITLCCESAWHPMYEAYLSIANFFGVNFELEAETLGPKEDLVSGIYVNTDINGTYLTTRYKVRLANRPEDGSLDTLFDKANWETDFNFHSDSELLQWFRERDIIADSIEMLQETLDEYYEYVCIHEFKNPY